MRLTKRFNCLFNLFFMLTASQIDGQTLTLEECYSKAEQLSPKKRNEQFLTTIGHLQDKNRSTDNLPVIMIEGTASYQSEVVTLPFSPPGTEIPAIPKDQYNVSLNITQKLYDGGVSRSRSIVEQAQISTERSQIEVSLYGIRQIINELFFGITLLEKNLGVLQLAKSELENQLSRARSGYENGVVLESELLVLRKEILKTDQLISDINLRMTSTERILTDWVGEFDSLVYNDASIEMDIKIERPELSLFQEQKNLNLARKEMIEAANQPKLSAFGRTGMGQPNPLNFFETSFEPYFIVGAKLSWNIWNWGNSKRDMEIQETRAIMIDMNLESFLQQTENEITRKQAEIEQYENLVETDEDLLAMQRVIANDAQRKFDLGTISATELVSIQNELKQLELNQNLHQVQLVKAKNELKILIGK